MKPNLSIELLQKRQMLINNEKSCKKNFALRWKNHEYIKILIYKSVDEITEEGMTTQHKKIMTLIKTMLMMMFRVRIKKKKI